jgi:hypothetical protein
MARPAVAGAVVVGAWAAGGGTWPQALKIGFGSILAAWGILDLTGWRGIDRELTREVETVPATRPFLRLFGAVWAGLGIAAVVSGILAL